jgi:hypothetical protein
MRDRNKAPGTAPLDLSNPALGVGRVGATEQRFLFSRATQQLEEIVGLETKSPATCGALFLRGYFFFQAPLASW